MTGTYNYPYKELWDTEAWKDRNSSIIPLAMWMDKNNIENNRIPAKPESERRTQGNYDPKAKALTFPETVEYWKNKGMHYHSTSMTLPWFALVPEEHMGVQGYDDNIDTVIVLVNADQSDISFGMYALDSYSDLLHEAADKGAAVLFVISDKPDTGNQYISIVQEAIILFHLNYRRIFLNVSSVYYAGKDLKSIPGFSYHDNHGNTVADPDSMIVKWYSSLLLEISGRWTNKDSLLCKSMYSNSASNLTYDRESLLNSEAGRKMAEAMRFEYEFDDAKDPALLQIWEDMGVRCEFHAKNGEQWISFVPVNAHNDQKEKLPCMCILQEVNEFDPHQAVTAFSFYYEYIKLAATGECMLLFFALESLDDNDMLHEILKDFETLYPLDRSRIYITGHSHNGRFAAEYMRRHQDEIAAVATLGNEPGQLSPAVTSGFFQISDEKIALQASVDIPLINISGFNERNTMFPLNSDAPHVRPGQWVAVDTFEKRSDSWQRRLKSARCPVSTIDEIEATRKSTDYVERQLGFPADKTEVLFLDGSENYIADVKNSDGNYHLRIVALGNMPHTVTPAMINLSWSFVRRFAKDLKENKCIELY